MADTIPMTFKDQTIDLPAGKAVEAVGIVPEMALTPLTPNQVQALIRVMEGDDTPAVQTIREKLLAVAEPLESAPATPFRL